MVDDESDIPAVNTEGESTAAAGENANESTTAGVSDPDGTPIEKDGAATENAESTGTGEPEKKPDGDGN